MRKSKLIIGGILLLALVLLAVPWTSTRSTAPLNRTLSFAFAGYTNDATGARLATFAVTNPTGVAIRRWAGCRIESQQQPGLCFMRSLGGPAVSLAPGQSEVVALLAPTNQGPWRAVLFCSRDGWRRRLSDLAFRSPIVPKRLRGIPVEYVTTSGWIEQ
jgi:hypothetical protein